MKAEVPPPPLLMFFGSSRVGLTFSSSALHHNTRLQLSLRFSSKLSEMNTVGRLARTVGKMNSTWVGLLNRGGQRSAVTTGSGAYFAEPKKVPMGLAAVLGTISVGLLLGAGISKNMASFLEENELFVPSDDDDDD